MSNQPKSVLDPTCVIVDELGAVAVKVLPSNENAVIVELAGRVNKSTERVSRQWAMAPGQAAELIANVVVAAQRGDPELKAEIDRFIKVEQERLAAVGEEYGTTHPRAIPLRPDRTSYNGPGFPVMHPQGPPVELSGDFDVCWREGQAAVLGRDDVQFWLVLEPVEL